MNNKLMLVLAIMLGTVHADVIPMGEHSVSHRLFIDNIDEYEEYQFFIFPTHVTNDISEGIALMDSDEIPGSYKLADTHLYAVKKSDMEGKTPEEYFPLALKSEQWLGRISTLPDNDPTTEIETHYEVKIENETLSLTEIETEKRERILPEPLPEPVQEERDYLPILAAFGIGLVVGYVAGKKL